MEESATVDHPLYLTPEAIGARFGNIPTLDGLRAFSILVVMLNHFANFTVPGSFGVLIFFAISGFLITRLLFAELKNTGKLSFRRFYARRVLRLYPIVIVYTATVVAMYLLFGLHVSSIEPLATIFYFANYLYANYSILGSVPKMPFGIFWSLSIEEHFYILFPIVFALMARRPKMLARTLALICIICLALRLEVAYLHPEYLGKLYIYQRSEFRADSIAFGVLLAIACEKEFGRELIRFFGRSEAVCAAILLILLSFIIRNQWFRDTFRYSFQSTGVIILMSALLFSNRYRYPQLILNYAPIKWIGTLSYSLYVWHFIVRDIIWRTLPGASSLFTLSIGFLLSLGIAAVSFYAIEKPAMGLRQRFGPTAGPSGYFRGGQRQQS